MSQEFTLSPKDFAVIQHTRELTSNEGKLAVGMAVMSVMVVGLRFASRAILPRSTRGTNAHKFWWDDWFCLIALVPILTQMALFVRVWVITDNLPTDSRQTTVADLKETIKDLRPIPKLWMAWYLVYHVTIVFPKLSALCFYYRVFSLSNRRNWRIGVFVVGGLCLAFIPYAFAVNVTWCADFSDSFRPGVKQNCGDVLSTWVATSVPNAALDVIVLTMPIPLVLKLGLDWKKKAGLLLVIFISYLTVLVSLGRLVALLVLERAAAPRQLYMVDPKLTWAPQLEGPISLVCVCIPVLFPLARRAFAARSPLPDLSGWSSPWSSRKTNLSEGDYYLDSHLEVDQGLDFGKDYKGAVDGSPLQPAHFYRDARHGEPVYLPEALAYDPMAGIVVRQSVRQSVRNVSYV